MRFGDNSVLDESGGIATVKNYHNTNEYRELRAKSGGSDANTLYTKTDVDAAIAAALAGVSYITKYDCTVANCANTTDETTVVSFVVPANTWATGEEIAIEIYTETGQHSGGDLTFTDKLYVAHGETTDSVTMANAVTIADAETAGRGWRGVTLWRNGTEIIFKVGSSTGGNFMPNTTVIHSGAAFAADNVGTNLFAAVDFTSAVTVSISAQWGGADATAYFNVISAKAVKI